MEKRTNNPKRFKIGDKAVYPGHGVAQITGLENREVAGVKKEFYVLKTLDSDIKLLIPVEGVNRNGLRSIIDREEVEAVLKILMTPQKDVLTQSWNRRQREYTEMLNSGSVTEIAKVLREVQRPETEKSLSYSERRIRDQARALLVDELALACKCDSRRAAKIIDEALTCAETVRANGPNPLKLLASHRAC
jgi:CarD family transcriptional regulator